MLKMLLEEATKRIFGVDHTCDPFSQGLTLTLFAAVVAGAVAIFS